MPQLRLAQAAGTQEPTSAHAQGWPVFAEDEIAAVADVLRSGQVNQWTGNKVKAFEAACARIFGAPYAVAVFNGTVALELALRALGIGPGDEVIVSSRSFMASASCVSVIGASPVFADVDARSQNITPETILPHITPRTRAILPVHLAGWPCDMPAIMALAQEYDLLVIEDCAQAHGALVGGRPAGSFGHAAAFSFCQDKIMTTGGEGGMVLFQEEGAYTRAWSYKDHGKDIVLSQSKSPVPGFRYVHNSIGTNWRMIETQAAIGLVQLGKLEGWVTLRTRNAGIWRNALSSCRSLAVPEPGNAVRHAYYKLYAFLDRARLKPGVTRDQVLKALVDDGIRAFTGSCPEIYREGAYAALALEARPVARALGETSLMFEVHPTLDERLLSATAARAAAIITRFER